MARKIHLDMDALTLGDLELFEEACGGDLIAALTPVIVRDEQGRPVKDPDDPKGRPLQQIRVNAKTLLGLVYVVLHKEDPTVTLESVKAMPLTDLDFDLGVPGDDDADPTELSDESTETSD